MIVVSSDGLDPLLHLVAQAEACVTEPEII
jgi:hypothetical protein